MIRNLTLYVLTVFIWGSTWLGIKFQLGHVDPLVSVAYRFCLAAAVLFVFCLARGLRMRFSAGDHAFMGLQGACLFAINYWFFYLAEVNLTSGIVAVTFSTIVFWNIINGYLLLRTPISPRVFLGAVLGTIGIAMVFWPELTAFSLVDESFRGLVLSLAATLLASFGNILSARNQKHGLPVIQTNAYGMAYGGLLMALVALAAGKPFAFETTLVYISSLIYLAVFGSIVAFGCYLTLVGTIGAAKAAYATLLFPIVALAFSTFFEGYRWSPPAVLGVVIIIAGNYVAIGRHAVPKSRSSACAGNVLNSQSSDV